MRAFGFVTRRLFLFSLRLSLHSVKFRINAMRDTALKTTEGLVERFARNLDAYKKGRYNETQLRREYIDPFFEALGWDIANKEGWAEQYKPVVHEDSLKVGISLKAPDYSFRLGGQRKFFLEAKKPSVSIKSDKNPAFQLRRYAWSAKLPLSILTDFEEFAVYDTRIRPSEKDKVSTSRINYITFEEYPERFDDIYDTFSWEAVKSGGFDRYAFEKKKKKGTTEVDGEFLREIERWREALAKNVALRNKRLKLDTHQLNFVVQQTIDRIIFLRICEDRGIENYGRLESLLNGVNVYKRLFELFYDADRKYNSGLFDFTSDTLTRELVVDDKTLKDIIGNLYYPKSPYEFSVLGSDILGSVYEQFLGKVITLSASGKTATVQEKPEVKKAGGVYYTPRYIVDYIVENTVGKLLEGKTPKKAERLKILDPACGSGSFLIGAYQYLLDWHLRWYTENDPAKRAKAKRPAIFHGAGGAWRLTTEEKKRILLNNIHGVDIDRQAVEVTKLSLLLKVIEDETRETSRMFSERILPNLKDNIRCGNSLIGPDFYSQGTFEMAGLDDDEARRINVFDWHDEEKGFGKIMNSGGFDCVIGNPPYVRQELLGGLKNYFQARYKVYHGTADLYSYFIERGVTLLKENGLFSYIVANKWMRAGYGEPLRRWMKKQAIEEITDFGDLPVFTGATTYPCILKIKNSKPAKNFSTIKVKTLDFESLQEHVEANAFKVERAGLDDAGWSLSGAGEERLLKKLRAAGVPLGEYVGGKIYYGIKTGFNEAFVIDEETRKRLIKEDKKSKELIRPFLAGRDIKRYREPVSDKYLIFTRRGVDIKRYPAIERHLGRYKKQLMPRPKNFKGERWPGRKPGAYKWYEIQDTVDYYAEFEKDKIMYLVFQVKPAFTYDSKQTLANNAVWIVPGSNKCLLAFLNSKLGWFLISKYCTQIQNGYQLIFKYLGKLPIRTIDFKNKKDKAAHDKMVKLVDAMLALNKKLAATKTPHERDLTERRIRAIDSQIDALVYELYGLTKEEIKIVEGE